LSEEAVGAFWAEAVGYARWEIGRYSRWRRLDEPVLGCGYDAEGVVQAAFERLIEREREGDGILEGAAGIQGELRGLIKRRVGWLHERKETRLTVREWEVLPAGVAGELVSIFDYLPGRMTAPNEELMRKEEGQLVEGFKQRFEASLGTRKDLLKVFRKECEGDNRREIAQAMGMSAEQVKALKAQLRRRLARFLGPRGRRGSQAIRRVDDG
jgi:DNA-directed RNA polymerase specialized sigma24 family protein